MTYKLLKELLIIKGDIYFKCSTKS